MVTDDRKPVLFESPPSRAAWIETDKARNYKQNSRVAALAGGVD